MARSLMHIPKEMYVGKKKASDSKSIIYTSGLCPNETARKSRMRTIERSADSTDVFVNRELPGFTLMKPGGHWKGGGDTWTVIDPRGFESTISAGNLAQIMSCTGITKGLIHDKCVWGYEGEVILLPVNSAPYLEAKENTDVIDKRVSLRDVKPGDKIYTHDKLTGIYMGGWNFNHGPDKYTSYGNVQLSNVKRKYVMRLEDKAGNLLGYYYSPAIKVSEVLEKATTPLKDNDVLSEIRGAIGSMTMGFTDYINDAIRAVNKSTSITRHRSDVPTGITKKKPDIELNFIADTADEMKKNIDNNFYVASDTSGNQYFVNGKGYRGELSNRIIKEIQNTKFIMEGYGYRNRNSLTESNINEVHRIEIKCK